MNKPNRPVNEFPSTFRIKSIGRDEDGFEALVVSIVRRHVPQLLMEDVSTRSSSGGVYVSVTTAVVLHSQEQYESLFEDLIREPRVLIVL